MRISSIEWETPQDFFDTLNDEFCFETDVCASSINTKCENFFSIEMDGLAQEWKNVCWMNPPYNKTMPRWVAKAYESAQKGAMVVVLMSCRSGDTKWWHAYVMKSSEIRFVKNRLHFSLNGKSSRANLSSIVVVFRPYCKGPPKTNSIDITGKENVNP